MNGHLRLISLLPSSCPPLTPAAPFPPLLLPAPAAFPVAHPWPPLSVAADPCATHAVAVKSKALAPSVSPSRTDARAANAAMCAYLRVGRLSNAREVFDRMPARDVECYSVLISGHAQLGSPAAAAALLASMRLCDALSFFGWRLGMDMTGGFYQSAGKRERQVGTT